MPEAAIYENRDAAPKDREVRSAEPELGPDAVPDASVPELTPQSKFGFRIAAPNTGHLLRSTQRQRCRPSLLLSRTLPVQQRSDMP